MNRFCNLIDALGGAPNERPFITMWSDEEEQETITFGEFRNRVHLQAKELRRQGLVDGSCVVIIMPQGIAAMTTFVAAMTLGAVPAFLAYPNFKVEPSKYRSGLAGVTANIKADVVVIDEDFPNDLLDYVSLGEESRLLRAGSNSGPAIEEEFNFPDIPSDHLAFIQHSAGTTGLQKGVALTHAAVLKQLDYLAQMLRVKGESDRIYSWLPLYHDMGLVACFMLPMVCHVPIVMQSPLDWVMHPETMLQIISEFKCTLAWLPNFAFQFVPRRAAKDHWAEYDLSSIRALINCSEPVRAASILEFHSAFDSIGLRKNALQSSYAMAENVFAVSQSDINRPSGPTQVWADGQRFRSSHIIACVSKESVGAVSFTSSGQLLPNTEVRIGSDSGEVLPTGHVGEILVRSGCLFEGYYNRPDITADVIVDGWYHTGDLGFLLQGELYVVGRKKDLLIVGGENLYPQDIEEAVADHPKVHDGRVVAMGMYNANLGTEDIVVIAELERDESVTTAAEIEREIRSRIVAGMGVAVRTVFLKPPNWIVKSTAGKPARSTTREKLLREHPELNFET